MILWTVKCNFELLGEMKVAYVTDRESIIHILYELSGPVVLRIPSEKSYPFLDQNIL